MGVPKRAVGYIRVSDESQADQDKASLSEQERSIREYCQSKGYDLLEIFSDVGKRWNADRPEFKRMIAWGQENPRPFDVIIVWRADRIVGSASTVAALEPLFDRKDIDIEGSAEVVNKGWLLLNALIAKGETEAKRHRGKLGIKTAVERGHYPGVPPYGRRLDKELRQIVVHEPEARWDREMFAWSISGDGDAKIAKRLNGLGVPTRMQGKVTASGRVVGKGWTASYVTRLLTDPAAYGEGKVQIKGGQSFIFPLPPVVDKSTFEQAMKTRQSRRHFGHRTTNRLYLISPRKGRCSECGLGFRIESRSYRVKKKTKDGVKVYERKTLSPALMCRGMYAYPHIHQCRKSKHIDFDEVQTIIVRRVSEALATDDFALACLMPDSSELDRMAVRVKSARDALEQTTREINFVVTEGRAGRIPKTVFDTQMAELSRVLQYREVQVRQVETEYQNASDKLGKFEKVLPLVNGLKDFWDAFTHVTVRSNTRSKDDSTVKLPVDSGGLDHLRKMLEIFVESFTIDGENNISVELNMPILENITADAIRCRQLNDIPSLIKGRGR